jgi:hypothetical protein
VLQAQTLYFEHATNFVGRILQPITNLLLAIIELRRTDKNLNQLAAGKCPLTDVTELPDKGPDRICGRIDLSPSPAPSTQNFRLPLAADSVFNGGLQTLDGVH